jgi:hypothetical protein
VTWGISPVYEPDAELVVGDGSGHGGTLGWLRFLPGKDGVEVLSFQFDEARAPYESKWPPDDAPVTVKNARLEPDRYAVLLHDLAIVSSAKLNPLVRNSATMSSNDFWVYVHLTTKEQTLLESDWAGYASSVEEPEFAKPRAAVQLARDAVKSLNFAAHALTDDERAWVSSRFARDMNRFKGRQFYWWVRERYIQTVGVAGDKHALPGLRNILATDPPRDSSEARCAYYAINAVTRLMKVDVRDQPVAEMDIETTRQKVLNLLDTERDEQGVNHRMTPPQQ